MASEDQRTITQWAQETFDDNATPLQVASRMQLEEGAVLNGTVQMEKGSGAVSDSQIGPVHESGGE